MRRYIKYFDKFSSNTYAGSANQLFFEMNENEICTGRIFYKISVGGEYNYSILFSNIIDSTFDDGRISHKNLICDEWIIHSAKIGRCKKWNDKKPLEQLVMDSDIVVLDFKEIHFEGKMSKVVMPGEFFTSDPVKFLFDAGDYLCLEISFSGKMIPYHEQTLLPVYIKKKDGWEYSKRMPFAGMIGCDRKVKSRVAYWGDSITQGCGTAHNSYLHWNAILSEKLGSQYSYWNLGVGFGRASDAASGGAWLYKATQNDIVFVCYGVNDLLQGQSEEQIKADLTYITNTLKKIGKKVILQTIPPFDYEGENVEKWKNINHYILTELKNIVDLVFDNTQILGKKETPQCAMYGGHPNEEGCAVWAKCLYEKILESKVL